MIETKRFVSRWMSLRKKISDIIWRKQNTFDTEGIGGFLSIIPEHLDHWKIVLTSTWRCLHYTIYTKNLENDNSGPCHSGSINTGTNHRVLPPNGGNGAILGGDHSNSNESPHMSDVQSDMIERRNLVFAVFGSNLRRATFTFFFPTILLQLDRLQLTAVYCNRRVV